MWRLDVVELEVFVGQVDPNPPVVRITLFPDGGRHIRELAAELADILDVLTGRTSELVAALRTAVEALGVLSGSVGPHPWPRRRVAEDDDASLT